MFKLNLAAVAATVCFVLTMSSAVLANGELDQVFEPDPSDGFVIGDIKNIETIEVQSAQSFTVARAGFLSCVEVVVASFNPDAGPLIVEIQSTNDDVPDGTVLASASITRDEVPETYSYLTFDFTADAVAVSVGDVLAIVLRADFLPTSVEDWYLWQGEAGANATYPGGVALSRVDDDWFRIPSVDLGFRTFVTTPTPVVETSWGQIKYQHQSH